MTKSKKCQIHSINENSNTLEMFRKEIIVYLYQNFEPTQLINQVPEKHVAVLF